MVKRIFFLILLFSFNIFAQDFETLFENLPEVGSWAIYKVTTISGGETKVYNMKISVTRKEIVDGDECFLVELYPFSFKMITLRTGTLGLLLKKNATQEELKNFVLRTKRIFFYQDGKDPFEVDLSLVEKIREASKDIKFFKEIISSEKEEREIKGKFFTIEAFKVKIFEENSNKEKIEVFEGVIRKCKDVPFNVISEEFEIKKEDTKKVKIKEKFFKVEVVDFGYLGAISVFPQNGIKKKGLFGILLG